MLKLCMSEPLAPPPLSVNTMEIVAVPLTPVVGVKVSVPVGLIAGPAANKAGLVLAVTLNSRTCPDSFGGPAEMFVAQLGTVGRLRFRSLFDSDLW